MGMDDFATGAVIHLGLDVLNERAVAPDIERLSAVADSKNGLLEVECVLQQELIDGGAGRVGLTTLGDWIFAKPLRVNVKAAARKQDALNTLEEAGDAVLAFVQGNDDGGNTRRVECGKIRRQRTLVVLSVAAGWLGDGDMEGHGCTSVMTKVGFAIEVFSPR